MDNTEKIYRNRITDSALELKLEAFGATLIVGPKGCGKTTTAKHYAKYVDAPDKPSGKRRQHIHIQYDGLGFIPLNELFAQEKA